MAHRCRHRLLRGRVRAHRLPRRPELVPQHRPQLGAARAVRGGAGDGPRPLRGGRPRPRRRVPRHGPADPRPDQVRAELEEDAHPPRLRSLDPAGAPRGGQRGHGGVSGGCCSQAAASPPGLPRPSSLPPPSLPIEPQGGAADLAARLGPLVGDAAMVTPWEFSVEGESDQADAHRAAGPRCVRHWRGGDDDRAAVHPRLPGRPS